MHNASTNTWEGRICGRNSEDFSVGLWEEITQTLCLTLSARVQPDTLVSVCVPRSANVFAHMFANAKAKRHVFEQTEEDATIWTKGTLPAKINKPDPLLAFWSESEDTYGAKNNVYLHESKQGHHHPRRFNNGGKVVKSKNLVSAKDYEIVSFVNR
jgi:hypothetical protein